MENVITTPKKMMKISELFSLSFKVYENKFWPLMGLILSPMLVVLAIFLIVAFYFFAKTLLNSGAILVFSTIILILAALILIALAVFVSIVSKIALAFIVMENPQEFSIIASLKKAAPYFKSYLWVGFLTGLFIVLGFILFIIPGFILAIYLSMTAWIFLNEGIKGMSAIKASYHMVKGYWWAMFWRLAVPFLVFMFLISLPTAFMEEKSLAMNSYNFVTQIISILIVPFVTSYTFNVYKSLKEVKA